MYRPFKYYNLVLGGGGIKGIAYGGLFEAAEKTGLRWVNIAGVSAGALAGAYYAAGYGSMQLKKIMEEFDFSKMILDDVEARVPLVERFMRYARYERNTGFERSSGTEILAEYIRRRESTAFDVNLQDCDADGDPRGTLIDSLVTISKEGCLFDGDYLEEWVRQVLAAIGIRTFRDVRGGIVDETNPRGYRIRMTAVDVTRLKVLALPDDITYYGIDPDDLEVAKAVRMSTAVPVAFKPVELQKKVGNSAKKYFIVDGGVLNSFPSWLIGRSPLPTIGFTLNGGGNKLLSLDRPLSIIKGLISLVHDTGVPKDTAHTVNYFAQIDTSEVGFLDFGLDDEEKEYLYNQGYKAARNLFHAEGIDAPFAYGFGRFPALRVPPFWMRRFRR